MANNRLYMRCKTCGGWIYLSKNFVSPYYITVEKCAELNEFFAEHAFCRNKNETYHEGGYFELKDEFDEGELLKEELHWKALKGKGE